MYNCIIYTYKPPPWYSVFSFLFGVFKFSCFKRCWQSCGRRNSFFLPLLHRIMGKKKQWGKKSGKRNGTVFVSRGQFFLTMAQNSGRKNRNNYPAFKKQAMMGKKKTVGRETAG